MFGSTPAASVSLRTGAEIRAVTPQAAAGVVDVTVQTATGTSATSEADRFQVRRAGRRTGWKIENRRKPPDVVARCDQPERRRARLDGRRRARRAGCRCAASTWSWRFTRSAAIRLLRTGNGQCRGTVTLRYKQKGKGKRFKLKTIGSARFSIAPGKSQVVRIKLNKLGRSLFLAGHGKLNASVAVVRTTPAPTLGKTASVRLSVKKTPKAKSVPK